MLCGSRAFCWFSGILIWAGSEEARHDILIDLFIWLFLCFCWLVGFVAGFGGAVYSS